MVKILLVFHGNLTGVSLQYEGHFVDIFLGILLKSELLGKAG